MDPFLTVFLFVIIMEKLNLIRGYMKFKYLYLFLSFSYSFAMESGSNQLILKNEEGEEEISNVSSLQNMCLASIEKNKLYKKALGTNILPDDLKDKIRSLAYIIKKSAKPNILSPVFKNEMVNIDENMVQFVQLLPEALMKAYEITESSNPDIQVIIKIFNMLNDLFEDEDGILFLKKYHPSSYAILEKINSHFSSVQDCTRKENGLINLEDVLRKKIERHLPLYRNYLLEFFDSIDKYSYNITFQSYPEYAANFEALMLLPSFHKNKKFLKQFIYFALKTNDITTIQKIIKLINLKQLFEKEAEEQSQHFNNQFQIFTIDKIGEIFNLACEHNNIPVINKFINEGYDINTNDQEAKQTPLFFATSSGNISLVKFLVEKGANVNVVDDFGQSPITLAVAQGYPDIIDILIDAGADINTKDNHVGTLLMLSISKNNKTSLKTLLRRGAALNVGAITGATALHIASQISDTEIVEELLKSGADLNALDLFGQSALHGAVVGKKRENLKMLIRYSKNMPGILNRQINETSIQISHDQVARLSDNILSGATPLFLAVFMEDEESIQILLDNGADVNIPNATGTTPLQLAEQKGLQNIINILKVAAS